MRDEKEIRGEVRRARERAKILSGFWIAELASAAYALEWALGKHGRPPSDDIGASDSAQGRIAASLVKAAEKEALAAKKAGAAKKAAPPTKKAGASGKPQPPLRRIK
jgi:hypothetical protein